jgi:UrcA family protein
MDIKLLQGSPFRTLALTSIACLIAAAPAGASQPSPEAASVTVSYGDLNLSTTEGASTLYRRIRLAADSVCGYKGRTLLEQQHWMSCFNGAVDRAVGSVDKPTVTSLHAHTSRRPV